MSKSYRTGPPEGPRLRKPQYEPTIEEELNDMAAPEEIFVLVNEWKPKDSPYELDEEVSRHRTEAGAITALHAAAQNLDIDTEELGDDTEFTIERPNNRTDYEMWYITTGTLED